MPDFVELPDELIESVDTWTGCDEWHSVYTIQLSELMAEGLDIWSYIDWSGSAFDQDQYERLCAAFEQRFMWREISMEPFSVWAQRVAYKLNYELMPKYKPLYEAEQQGLNVLADGDEYFKHREIGSDYPETLLSANSDYVSIGKDIEDERLKFGNLPDAYQRVYEKYRSIDAMILDELECMFIGLYSANVNGW